MTKYHMKFENESIQCIIFDCDGTLVDSEYWCNYGLEIKLREYRIKASAQQMMRDYRGGKLVDILTSLESKHKIRFDNNFVASYRALVAQLFEQHLTAITGIREALATIQLEQNRAICVASSGPYQKIQQALSISRLSHFFQRNIFSSYDIQSWKPEPDLFRYAARKMAVATQNCIIVDDSQVGIDAARAAKMRAIYYQPQNFTRQYRNSTVTQIHSMSQLPAAINAMASRSETV